MGDMLYSITATGPQDVNGVLLACQTCRVNTGLTFVTSQSDPRVTGCCPRGHTWTETRLPSASVRAAAIQAGGAHPS